MPPPVGGHFRPYVESVHHMIDFTITKSAPYKKSPPYFEDFFKTSLYETTCRTVKIFLQLMVYSTRWVIVILLFCFDHGSVVNCNIRKSTMPPVCGCCGTNKADKLSNYCTCRPNHIYLGRRRLRIYGMGGGF